VDYEELTLETGKRLFAFSPFPKCIIISCFLVPVYAKTNLVVATSFHYLLPME